MIDRKTLTEWPTDIPPEELVGRWEYHKNGEVTAGQFMPVDSAYRWLFLSDDKGTIVWGIMPGECFIPVEGEPPLDEVSTLRARVAEMEAQLAAPLRLGRGPTVEEVEAFAAREPDGLWLLRSGLAADEDGMSTWTEERLFVEGAAVRVPARWGSRRLDTCNIVDAIPLNAARQPCRVGEKA